MTNETCSRRYHLADGLESCQCCTDREVTCWHDLTPRTTPVSVATGWDVFNGLMADTFGKER